jgi:hypothetical protein
MMTFIMLWRGGSMAELANIVVNHEIAGGFRTRGDCRAKMRRA